MKIFSGNSSPALRMIEVFYISIKSVIFVRLYERGKFT